jgi:hypothetical protein
VLVEIYRRRYRWNIMAQKPGVIGRNGLPSEMKLPKSSVRTWCFSAESLGSLGGKRTEGYVMFGWVEATQR